MLLETLEALQRENGNVVKAAERLDIHRNTLHQRVQRIETLTGYAINNPQFHLNASVALVIWRMSQSHLEEKMKIINARLRHQFRLHTIEVKEGLIASIVGQSDHFPCNRRGY